MINIVEFLIQTLHFTEIHCTGVCKCTFAMKQESSEEGIVNLHAVFQVLMGRKISFIHYIAFHFDA